jgi:hypothetical protein
MVSVLAWQQKAEEQYFLLDAQKGELVFPLKDIVLIPQNTILN